jgi:hypothetical protein
VPSSGSGIFGAAGASGGVWGVVPRILSSVGVLVTARLGLDMARLGLDIAIDARVAHSDRGASRPPLDAGPPVPGPGGYKMSSRLGISRASATFARLRLK